MNPLFACIAITALVSVVASRGDNRKRSVVAEAFINADIVPEILPVAPAQLLEVKYGRFQVNLGNKIIPSKAINIPTLEFKLCHGCYFTFIFFDPDVPSESDPRWRSFVMGLYVNLIDTTLDPDCAISPYIPPNPIPGTGKHRYILLVYQQMGRIDVRSPGLHNFQTHISFSIVEFAEKYKLGKPVAGNFFVSEFPHGFDFIYTIFV